MFKKIKQWAAKLVSKSVIAKVVLIVAGMVTSYLIQWGVAPESAEQFASQLSEILIHLITVLVASLV